MNDLQQVQEQDRLARIEAKVDDVYRSAEKTRKYFLVTLIVTVVAIVLPLIGTVIIVPYYLSTLDLASFGL